MKLRIGDFEIEIKARNTKLKHETMNKKDTMEFLNEMSLAYSAVSDCYENNFGERWESFDNKAEEVYRFLNIRGYYK